jgi:quercetin dioxygenase-like cupin family protein
MARKRVNTRGYASWLEQEGLPIYTGYAITDVNALALAPSDRLGGSGAYVRLEGTDDLTGLYVHEIPPGQVLEPERHLYEEVIYVLSGHGRAEYWRDDSGKVQFDWQRGSVFASPLNTWHRYVNTSDREPTRYMAVTNAPVLMNIFRDADFLFQNDYFFANRFTGRYDWSGSFFSANPTEVDTEYLDGEAVERNYETNFIADVRQMPLEDMPEAITRGEGLRQRKLFLANNTMLTFAHEYQPGTYTGSVAESWALHTGAWPTEVGRGEQRQVTLKSCGRAAATPSPGAGDVGPGPSARRTRSAGSARGRGRGSGRLPRRTA